MHHRFRNLGLMAVLAIAAAIPIAANAAPLPDPNVGQYETKYTLTIDQTAAAVPAPDIATAYVDHGYDSTNWTIASTSPLPSGNYALDNANSPGEVPNYSYVISARDNATSAVVHGTSSASAGLSLDFAYNVNGNDGSGLAHNSTPAVARVCSYVGLTDYAQSSTSGAGNHYLLS